MDPTLTARPVVALFDASDDTRATVQRMLAASGYVCLAGCHVSDLQHGFVNFGRYLTQHDPAVVIIDISPPYADNWAFFTTLRDDVAVVGRGLVLTTTDKQRLITAVGHDVDAFECVEKPYDLGHIQRAIDAALKSVSRTPR